MKRKILKTLIVSTLIVSNTFAITANAVEISTETTTVESSADTITVVEKGTTDLEIYKTDKGKFELWRLRDGTYEIMSYSGSDTILRIPDTVKGYPVTTVSPYMLSEVNSTVKELVLPRELECINGKYLEKFSTLEKVSINNGTKYISENGILFNKDKTELIYYPIKKTGTSYTIPESVRTICSSAFLNNKFISNVYLHDGIKAIHYSAFEGCTSITSIKLPSNLETLGMSVFRASGIKSITIPAKVTVLSESTFENCKNLSSIELNSGLLYISGNAFKGCSNLTNLTIPSSVKKIDADALCGASKLKTLKALNKSMEYSPYALNDLKGVTLYGYAGSTTETYAKEYGFIFIKLVESNIKPELTVSGTCKVGNTITISTPKQNDAQY